MTIEPASTPNAGPTPNAANSPRHGESLPADANPFSTSRVQPGAMPYRFAPGESIDQLRERLVELGNRCQIVGPHGVGKSTLMQSLARAVRAVGDSVAVVRIGAGERTFRWPSGMAPPSPAPRTWLFVDGWEQLRWWCRVSTVWQCRRRNWGLLVTCHDDMGWPELARLRVDGERLREVIGELTRGYPPWIGEAEIAEAYARHPNNAREILFRLYDLYEVRRREARSSRRS